MAFVNFIDEDLMPCQIFDANETGLNYKMFPKKTLASKLDSLAKGHKVKKERVTLRPCSNASGDLKFPLLVIGKSAKPRAFKNVNMSALPAQYTSQKSAWMNGNIFKNCENELRDGEMYMKFLPPNVTALIKPMDQRVIKTTKRLYRKKLIVFLLEQQEANPLVNFMDLLKKVTIKTVLYLAAEGWEGIKKHFKKVGKNFFQELKGCADVKVNDISEWINGDTDVGHQVLSEDEIVNACIENIEIEVDSSEDGDDGTDQSTGPTHGEATVMLEQLMTYFEKQIEIDRIERIFNKSL
ncbi:jerky protein homolog-like [Sipha flava]|uniref:Jerky protein homolog-like n=1 Tax=Sipha flava TaxID=143950 RepID=A0A8B8GBE2_9HEMI|nr:jerky protein homolog-like [Sipha flava]